MNKMYHTISSLTNNIKAGGEGMQGLDNILNKVSVVESDEENVLITYDTHLSDKRSDRHKDYWEDSMDVCAETLRMVREHKAHHVILPGDLIGRMKDKNLSTREGFLYVTMWLQELNDITDGHVYIVEGNHDQSSKLTDYQMFVAMGLIKNIPYFDTKITRFHLINYGDERREVEIREGANNVAVMHNELTVDGATTWFFNSKHAISLASLTNLKGITRIYSGHIHTPSPKPVEYMIDGVEGILHYMGCPTKPSYNRNDYEYVYPVLVSSTDTTVKEKIVPYELKKDVWMQSINTVDAEVPDIENKEYEEETFDVKKLTEILSSLQEYNMLGSNDYTQQIKALTVTNKDLEEFTMAYIERAESLFDETGDTILSK